MGKEETNITNRIRLILAGFGKLFRNNVGAYKDPFGNFVKYGVCNPGGSDLIGWTQVRVTPDMVGKTLAVFTAVEIKTQKGTATPPQQNFINQVIMSGGIGFVARTGTEAKDRMTAQIAVLQERK